MGQLTIKNASEEILGAQGEFEEVAQNILLFRREYQFAMQALEKNDYLLRIALANPQSLKNAIVNVGAVGLSLNPAESLAYLVPMDDAVQLQISYMGFINLAVADGGVQWAHAEIVKEKDVFKYIGVGDKPVHEMNYFQDRGKIIGTYCVAKTHDGSYLTRMMTYEECLKIRGRSKLWIKKPNSGPWFTDEEEMIKKTVLKRGRKTWPKGVGRRLDKAIEVTNEFEGIDFTPPKEGAHKISDASNLLNTTLGNSVDPDMLKVTNDIKATCKILCAGFTEAEKRKFMLEKLEVTSFNDLFNKSLESLKELDLHLLGQVPIDDPEPEDQSELKLIGMPEWDEPIVEGKE